MSEPGYQTATVRWFVVILAIIALPALGFGLWSFKMLFYDYLWTARQAQQWPQVQATVVDVDWKWIKARPMSSGPLGRDMQIVVHYQYRFGSGVYTGRDVGFESFAARDRDLYRRLHGVMKRHGTVTAWVNPERPEQAALDIEIRMLAVGVYVLIGSLLTGIGGGILFLLGRTPLE